MSNPDGFLITDVDEIFEGDADRMIVLTGDGPEYDDNTLILISTRHYYILDGDSMYVVDAKGARACGDTEAELASAAMSNTTECYSVSDKFYLELMRRRDFAQWKS